MTTLLFDNSTDIECHLINSFNSSAEQCSFLSSREDCREDDGIIDYLNLFYCVIGSYESKIPSLLTAAVLLFFLFLFMGVTAEDFLCPNLVAVSNSLRLSQNIAGVTFLAFGNGAPDIFSSIAGIRQARAELVIGELFGAGIFVVTVVVGSILLTGRFSIMQRPIVRDILFYGTACFLIWGIIYQGRVYLWQTILILSIYGLYITVVIVGRIIYQRQMKKRQMEFTSEIEAGVGSNAAVFPVSSFKRRRSSAGLPIKHINGLRNGLSATTSPPQPVISIISVEGTTIIPAVEEITENGGVRNAYVNPAFDADVAIDSVERSRAGSTASILQRRRSHRSPSVCSHQSHKIRHHNENVMYSITHSTDLNPSEPCADPFCRRRASHYSLRSNRSDRSGQSDNQPPPPYPRTHNHLEAMPSYETFVESTGESVFHSTSDILAASGDSRGSEEEWTIYLDSLSPMRDFFYRLSPFGWEEFKKMSIFSKILTLVKAPFILIISLTTPIVDRENHRDNWCRLLNCLHCITGPIWLCFVSGCFSVKIGSGQFPLPALFALIGLAVSILVFLTSKFHKPPIYHWVFSILGFVVAGSWTYLLASEVVSLLKGVGILINLSDAILGLTVLAWGNSLGDLVSNVSMARQGFPKMGISACFGGPLLNLLLGIGIPYTILLPELPDKSITIEYTRMFTLLIVTLIIVLMVTFTVFVTTGFRSFKLHGITLIVIYFGYLTIAICLETKVF